MVCQSPFDGLVRIRITYLRKVTVISEMTVTWLPRISCWFMHSVIEGGVSTPPWSEIWKSRHQITLGLTHYSFIIYYNWEKEMKSNIWAFALIIARKGDFRLATWISTCSACLVIYSSTFNDTLLKDLDFVMVKGRLNTILMQLSPLRRGVRRVFLL